MYHLEGILCDFFIFTLEKIIVLNVPIDNKPIPKTSHVKTLQNLCKMKKVRNTLLNVDCVAIRARIALKLGGLLSFMIRNAYL